MQLGILSKYVKNIANNTIFGLLTTNNFCIYTKIQPNVNILKKTQIIRDENRNDESNQEE